MTDSPKVPFPLPSLPRLDPPSDLARLAVRVLEHRDLEALTRLPDMLQEMSRTNDVDLLKTLMAGAIHFAPVSGTPSLRPAFWEELTRLLFWDIFDWASTLRVLGEQAAKKASTFASGTSGRMMMGDGTRVPVTSWTIPSGPEPDPAWDDERHVSESHPDYEYAVTSATNAAGEIMPPSGGEWEPNYSSDRFLFIDRVHWMRRRSAN